MTNLGALWEALQSPTSDGGLTFATADIPGLTGVMLGRGAAGPALLFEVADPGAPRAPIELKNLAARFNVACRVERSGTTSEGRYTVVVCTSEDANLHNLFLEALEPLLTTALTDGRSISRIIESLVELFRRLDGSPQTSILGLWGEIFTIMTAVDPDRLLLAWHQLPQDHYDFALESERLEVKTTTGSRRHRFSLEQLRPPQGTELWIYSVITESSAAGATVLDLINTAAARCATPDAASRLMDGAVQALGPDVTAWRSMRYDVARAIESRRLLPASAIPCVANPASEISEVRFVVDLTSTSHSLAQPQSTLSRAVVGGDSCT